MSFGNIPAPVTQLGMEQQFEKVKMMAEFDRWCEKVKTCRSQSELDELLQQMRGIVKGCIDWNYILKANLANLVKSHATEKM